MAASLNGKVNIAKIVQIIKQKLSLSIKTAPLIYAQSR